MNSTSPIGKQAIFKKKFLNTSTYLIIAFVIFMVILYIFPLLYLINISLKTPKDFMMNPTSFTKSLINIENYITVFEKNNLLLFFFNSVWYAFTANILTLSVTALAAFVISRKYVKFSNFFYILFLMGIFLPDPLIPQFLLIRSLGLYNNPIGYILIRTNPGIIMLLMVGYYKTIPKEFDEAAALDGCGTVPLFTFIGQYGNNWPPLAAAVFLVALPVIVLFLFFQKHIISSMVASGLKG